MAKKEEKKKAPLTPQEKKKYGRWIWIFGLLPLVVLMCLLLFQPDSSMPPVSMLDNPPELQASVIIADDAKSEMGRFWQVNRTSVKFNEISPYVIDALISTEDERFMEHTGVDFLALARAIVRLGQDGGGSTITQQLAKQLFTLKRRQEANLNEEAYVPEKASKYKIFRLLGRINEKAQENIIATRLEKRFTKEEIITMYLNQFDFLYNAVGIKNAAKVYFNKKPIDLTKEEAAMLVGMCKNPSLYNPHHHESKDYRFILAINKGVSQDEITEAEILERRSKDSLRATYRRNTVLAQWLKNSKANNPALREKITQEEYEKLKEIPIKTDYQIVDHKEGSAPYFREAIRKELKNLFAETKPDGTLKYEHPEGRKYNIYNDGLKIYTTINLNMQEHAEQAMEKHLKNMQPKFRAQLTNLRRFPYSNDLSEDQVTRALARSKKNSDRYRRLKAQGFSQKQIDKSFDSPAPMRVFSWKGDIDTIMTPNDSIIYYKTFLRAGLLSIEPQTGFVKAWVGGADIRHFSYDCVSQVQRQVGSTIKPFVYATALAMGTSKPCTTFNGGYCVGNWCPGGKAAGTMADGLAYSSNPTTVAVMSTMGPLAGKENIAKFLREVDIDLPRSQITPPMCLGTMSLSLFQLIPAQAMFVNQGIYNSPSTILRVEDRNGNIIYQAQPKTKEVLHQNFAYTMMSMLKGVVQRGTAKRIRAAANGGISVPMAGKTGTTQNNSDAWFVGFTPELVTGVWVGGEERSIRWKWTGIGQGAAAALPMYGYYMNKVYKDKKIKISTGDFEKPADYDPIQFSCDGVTGISGGEYYFYQEPEKSDETNPFL